MTALTGSCTDHKTNILKMERQVWVTERSFQALGMAYRALRNSYKFKQGQEQSVEDTLVEPPASKGLLEMFAR